MRTLGNILWFIFGGMFGGLAWIFAGCIWCITIVGIPFGRQFFKMARLSFMPFGTSVIDKGVWKKIGLPVFFYAYHEAAIPLMQIET